MRLIDADALLKNAGVFEAAAGSRGCGKSILCFVKAWIWSMVNDAPTIDAVPVVRCKDCAFMGHFKCPMDEWVKPDENGFCHYGKRKDGGG